MFGNFSLFKTPFPGRSSIPPSFVSFFVFYIFSHLLSKTMGCFSGCLMSSASIQKLFCGIYSAFKCSFDEFVGEKVFSPSYSSAILAPPPRIDAFELWCWRRLLRVPWTARRSNQSILKEISPGISLEGMMLKLKLQYFGHLMRRADSLKNTLILGKIEGKRRRGCQKDEMVR